MTAEVMDIYNARLKLHFSTAHWDQSKFNFLARVKVGISSLSLSLTQWASAFICVFITVSIILLQYQGQKERNCQNPNHS